jgi:hypothetical protein
MGHPLTLVPDRMHLAYTEPHSIRGVWTSPPRCLPDRVAAEEHRDSTTVLADPSAAARRTWTITPCTCGGAR